MAPAKVVDPNSVEGEMDDYLSMVSMTTAFALPFVLKAVVSLGVFDILAEEESSRKPVSLDHILSKVSSRTPPNADIVHRLLSSLARAKVLREHPFGHFSFTHVSKWLVKDQPMSLVPFLTLATSPEFQVSWQYLYDVALDGGSAFQKANGMGFYEEAAQDPAFNKILSEGMNSFSAATMAVVLKHYDGFQDITKLVDVGGGNGMCMTKIFQAYPHIKGTVLDRPHVIAQATKTPGIEYIGGDFFKSVPSGDALFVKSIFHNWDDEKCLLLLSNCNKALPPGGKIIIVDMIFNPVKKNKGMDLDLMMIGITGGKERSEKEWKELLLPHGFSNISFEYLPTNEGLIEATKV